ncbi:MAG: hypothetical protein J2P49_05365 [Methylocapsa sp.]|nr:hypothetical protein [Methylocapsa sp.]
MNSQQDPNRGLMITLTAFGILSVLGVVFAGSLFFERKQYDTFSTSGDYRTYQERVMAANLRREIAEEFTTGVISCASPPLTPGENLSEEQISASITAAAVRLSAPLERIEDKKCRNSRSVHWSFEPPCRLAISEAFVKSTGGLNLGEISLCESAVAKIIHSSARACQHAADFPACLATAVLTNEEVKSEIEKPFEKR